MKNQRSKTKDKKHKPKIFIFLICVFGFWFFISNFSAFAGDPAKDKLDALDKTIKSMQADSVARNEKVASSLATIEQVKQEYQSIQGTIETNSHLIQQQTAEISRLKRDIADRLSAIEDRLEIYDQQITKAVAKILPGASNEAESYQKALDLVQKSDFLSAVASFRVFLKSHSKSELADNAQYWIGECYFALKDYPKSIKEFQALLDRHPKSTKAQSAVLKQGLAFAELGMPDESKTFLNKVISEYPGSDEALRAKEKIDRLNQKTDNPLTAVPSVQAKPLDSTSNIPLAPGLKQQPKPKDDLAPAAAPKGRN